MSSFEEHKQFLSKDSAGTNLYDHLSSVLLKLVDEQPDNPAAVFESLSAGVKDSVFAVKDEIEGDSLPGQGEVPESKSAQTGWATSASGLFKEPEDFDAAEQKVQDWAGDAAMLEWAGVSFGAEESYRLSLSLKHLAAAVGASDLRLWGKITGTGSDYYIAEGNTAEGVEGADKNTMDYYGECTAVAGDGYRIGANAHTYWACSHAGADWVKLPDVTCQQIVVSRALRKMFTGDLDAPVYGYPTFPGTEQNYLRAIISRISSDTVIVPEGVFEKGTLEEEAEDAAELMLMSKEDMETDLRAVEEIADPSSWVHLELGLNKIGRATPFPVNPDEEEPEENPDAELAGAALRVVGDEEGFEEKYIKKVCSQFAVIRNMKWPGSYTVANQRSFANVYVGTGVEYSAKPYKPQLPPAIMTEWKPAEDAADGDKEDNAYCGANMTFHGDEKIQFDPHTEEEVDDE